MGKSGFTTTIPYGNELHEVTALEYEAWNDALLACDGSSDAMEWATYDLLTSQGYFISKPKCNRPILVDTRGTNQNSGFGSNVSGGEFNGQSGVWEPEWTQSRLLSERAKLLKERENLFNVRKQALDEKIIAHMEAVKNLRTDPSERVNQIIGFIIIFMVIWWLFF